MKAMVPRAEVLAARPDLTAAWDRAHASFPVRVTRSWWDRMDPADRDDPLAVQVLPDPRELLPDPEGLTDPVGEGELHPVPWLVHKHPDRVLLLTTRRCHVYCRYCFRRADGGPLDPSAAEWEAALDYAVRSGASEVILSGGDPLILRDDALTATIDRLRARRPVVVRIHTRAPVSFPARVTAALVAALRVRAPVWMVVHCNHPRELSAEVDRALARLVDAGIPTLNQTVLLKGVNDDVETLVALCEAMVARRVFPYYLHHTDRVVGNAHLRVPLGQGRELHRALAARVSGVACPRYVVDLPDGSGKVDAFDPRVEGIIAGSGYTAPPAGGEVR